MAFSQIEFHVFLFHAFGFSLYGCNLIYESYYVITPGSLTYAGRWKFLTHWNEVIQFMYFMLATFVDILPWVMKQKKHWLSSRLRDFIFSVIAFPIATLVSVMFWTIYAINRELIYPADLDAIIPSMVNHILHTACSCLMILEALIVHHKYPGTNTGLLTLFTFGLLYYSWMSWVAYVASEWPYGFLESFTALAHGAFVLASYCLLCLFYCAGQCITTIRWSNGNCKFFGFS